ncbi:glycosyltransferase family 2 protein [Frankia sp. CNm7]|uniref:Glycosyltransferase family 2 protein n=1 Tax=Frankia nepalensis TaxID=1836974 RepID=A0A937RKV1_9ACTN|nr:glycosyltransferase family 2 protein [Frankia nepalensis]MBL7498963.1 glycosyltransferase family 2 protein [Frankia nepalensis]MBL7511240.1 glycosyltransferase family 2 protein [Frankia nepalensis]MBL7520586.1 glycosyltransferase family 2 protein [Frankia nepalensis]MBL7630760.1 glycosyltransferase family 2 protein [Frankia nepalensis]
MLTQSHQRSTSVDVVLPCLDEAEALPWVLDRIPPGYRAVVADNGSRDGSARLARERGAVVVDVPRRGYGAAVHAGLLAADADVVCVCDADASLDPAQLPKLVAELTAGRADLVLGRRRPTSFRAWPPHARLGNAIVAQRLRRRGVGVHDLGPMRVARRAELLRLPITDRRFGYPLELLLRAAQAGWRIVETDVDYHPRAGRSKVTGTPLGTARTVRDMTAALASLR